MTEANDRDETSGSRLFRCAGCGNYHPGRRAADGTLKPATGGRENRCRDCGGDEFVRVPLATPSRE